MVHLLEYVVAHISGVEPKTGAKLRKYIEQQDTTFQARAERFLSQFQQFLESKGQAFDHGIECYLKLREAMAIERMTFLENGRYSNTSFAQVAESVYHNTAVMEYHMYGLVLAQFLWPDQYHRYSFFCDAFSSYAPRINNYLEIGGGHALYVAEAALALSPEAHIDVVDISPSSLELAQGMLPGAPVSWHNADIFDFVTDRHYDFVVAGEVLEHLEDPLAMLRKIRDLLAPDGSAYITTPANAPMIDHIYHFNNAHEIREMLQSAGFAIEAETSMFSTSMAPALAEELKIPLMYAAFVRPC
jgi:SAM-dependent methyltransferase